MKQLMQPIRDFQLQHRVPIYFGEFSCVRWAPGNSSYAYNTDAVSIFDEFDWSWSFHSFRGYRGWDAELPRGGSNEVRSMNTDMMRYLRQRMLALNP